MTNQQENDITRRMSENIAGKFSYLASQLPGMKVKHLNGLQYVDCGRQSDTFNTVLGTPASTDDIAQITRYYQQMNRPAAWWFSEPTTAYAQALRQAGWEHEENEVGMHLSLTSQLQTKSDTVLSRIEYCDSLSHFQDFGRVLSAIFEPGNTVEAENIRAIYQQAGEHSASLDDRLIQLVGYFDDQPVSTATLYFHHNIAGVFDIATPECWRRRGFGSEIFYQALRVAQQKKATACVLQASPDGVNIYKKAGFISTGNFEVWNLPQNN